MATDLPCPRVTPWRASALAAATLLGGCVMGPNFQRPETTSPPAWAGAASAPADLPSRPVARPFDGRRW